MEDDNRIQLNIAICDDEPVFVRKIGQICREILGKRYDLMLETAESGQELLQKTMPVQIAILDVRMPGTDGIELARTLLCKYPKCRILFVSGYTNIVSDVYEVPHLCLILKDQLELKLPCYLRRAAAMAAEESGKTIGIVVGKQVVDISLCDIVTLERRGHITFGKLADGSMIQTKEKLVDLLQRIGSCRFVRCHISYAVNLSFVKQEEFNGFRMKTGDWVPISRPHQQDCRDAFWRFISEQPEAFREIS